MKKNIIATFTLAAITASLMACGDETTKVTRINEIPGMQVVDGDDMPKCTDENESVMVYMSEEDEAYICVGGKWENLSEATSSGKALDGEDGTACVSEVLKDSSGYKILCGGDSVGVILNGKDGKNGENGKDGQDGTDGKVYDGKDGDDGKFCTMEEILDGSAYKIICAGDSVGVILNGEPGVNGKELEDLGL